MDKKSVSLVVAEAITEIIKNVDGEVTFSTQKDIPEMFFKKGKGKKTIVTIEIIEI